MAQNPLVEQAKQGNVNAIASLMNRLLKSQGMLANVERDGDRLEILIESDLRSLDDEVRIPKRQVLVRMIKKWFVTLEVKTVSAIKISWQQTGSHEPAWTEEIHLIEPLIELGIEPLIELEEQDIRQNSGVEESQGRPKVLPTLIPKSRAGQSDLSSDRYDSDNKPASSNPDLDEMFGETSHPSDLISDLETTRFQQDSEFIIPTDVPSVPESISDFQSEPTVSSRGFSLQTFLQTPNFAIQFLQYCIVCAIIILTVRGIHAAFGSSKAPKAASIDTHQIVL